MAIKCKCLYAVKYVQMVSVILLWETPFKVNSVTLFFLGYTASKTNMYLLSCDKALCKKIGM